MCICVVFVVCVVGLCGAWQGVKILEECTDMEDRDKWVQVSGWLTKPETRNPDP